ncbi:MAG TPA: 16S rRNA (guanine(527)-N(7))-methyltransferase RsmG [Candidatus Dormibacteraeota bacterium]|jgi:16S rRNA (guanine527-N7)-methyltransferase|nr:16S rRNA (guanine(527)-N(7))-methyltransferase RsmG [Candidatus Dormibacteraeota bacterium]
MPDGLDALDDSTRARLLAYLDELQRWNARVNLTAIPAERGWEKHVVETERLHRAVAAHLDAGASVIDIGAGGGVPGIPLAILRPDVRVTLLDSDTRKAGFLTHAAGALQLDNVSVVVARAEEVARRPGVRESFDVAVSRALAPPPVMCELALPLVRVGGVVAALVGDASQAARECARAAQECGGAQPSTAPGDVLLVDKLRATPEAYPRRAGMPLKRPLL